MPNTLNFLNILENRRIFQSYLDSLDNIETSGKQELFSSEQMKLHGRVLAQSHRILEKSENERLLSRLDENEIIILKSRKILVESIREKKFISPAAEWLLDNFYLIEEQFLNARKHLPKGYSTSLPHLASGYSSGKPRVYDIALDIISHSDGRIDISSLTQFIESYQSHTILSLGELWAIPIMLRLAVLENLRRLSIVVALEMIDQNLADYWAFRLWETAKQEPENLVLILSELAKSKPLFTKSFVAQFIKMVKGKGKILVLALNWIEQQLFRDSFDSDHLVQKNNQSQASDQVAVSNSISTLRLLGSTDWNLFVEGLSVVERIMKNDPSGIYPGRIQNTGDRSFNDFK